MTTETLKDWRGVVINYAMVALFMGIIIGFVAGYLVGGLV